MFQLHVMTPDHPRWNEFVTELSRACICMETADNAHRVLSKMGGLDPELSIAALRALGGSCDCAIVFEVAAVAERKPA